MVGMRRVGRVVQVLLQLVQQRRVRHAERGRGRVRAVRAVRAVCSAGGVRVRGASSSEMLMVRVRVGVVRWVVGWRVRVRRSGAGVRMCVLAVGVAVAGRRVVGVVVVLLLSVCGVWRVRVGGAAGGRCFCGGRVDVSAAAVVVLVVAVAVLADGQHDLNESERAESKRCKASIVKGTAPRCKRVGRVAARQVVTAPNWPTMAC